MTTSMPMMGATTGPVALPNGPQFRPNSKVITGPCDDAEREAHREDPFPEPVHLEVDRITAAQIAAIYERQKNGQSDRDSRERHVEHDRDGKLPAGEFQHRR
ncbi:hypothetical protein I6J71_08670 [Amycolatopsis sp. FDAARGOS 1241]|nr:hypothetical protein [Amycolatopsis sp. FDAARGOS 1241]QRP51372.1 hypothetical protein I6J71_08670 [Amycolatopsis sp. FDAARGOS 1241]